MIQNHSSFVWRQVWNYLMLLFFGGMIDGFEVLRYEYEKCWHKGFQELLN